MNFRGDTVATRQGREFERGKGRMVMAQADEAVLRHSSEKMFYARYCDDMVIAATDESLCRRAMDAYFAALDQLPFSTAAELGKQLIQKRHSCLNLGKFIPRLGNVFVY